ncbi:MAG: hypothetical protein P4L31_05720 [Candidatus Babeliales bacterium]|nr:hypothetical protein [Candidatus Babeliales bacterium]
MMNSKKILIFTIILCGASPTGFLLASFETQKSFTFKSIAMQHAPTACLTRTDSDSPMSHRASRLSLTPCHTENQTPTRYEQTPRSRYSTPTSPIVRDFSNCPSPASIPVTQRPSPVLPKPVYMPSQDNMYPATVHYYPEIDPIKFDPATSVLVSIRTQSTNPEAWPVNRQKTLRAFEQIQNLYDSHNPGKIENFDFTLLSQNGTQHQILSRVYTTKPDQDGYAVPKKEIYKVIAPHGSSKYANPDLVLYLKILKKENSESWKLLCTNLTDDIRTLFPLINEKDGKDQIASIFEKVQKLQMQDSIQCTTHIQSKI